MKRITPDMPPDVARQIMIEEMGDLNARILLVQVADHLYRHNQKHAAASLLHAVVYLADRDRYIAEPWPKGMIKDPEGAR